MTPQIAVESDVKNDWFSLSFNLEFDGVKLPLTPLLSSFITEFNQDESREYVNLEVRPDYFVRIKTKQIKPILEVILQLYDGQSENIKVGAYEAHRIGQTKVVFVYKLIVENSIEEKILELQKKKLQLQQGIYKGGKTEKVSGEELLKLLN